MYVHHIIFNSTNEGLCQEFVVAIKSEFEMSMMGELNYFLHLWVKQLKQGTFLEQSKDNKDLLNKYEMEKCKTAATPISTSFHIDANEKGVVVDQTKYIRLIESLLYLTICKLDIMFSVCLCARRYQANPKQLHYNVAKRILKYLK